MSFDVSQLGPVAPMLTIFVGGILLLLLEAFAGGRQRTYLSPLTVAICVIAVGLEMWGWSDSAQARSVFDGQLTVDRMTVIADLLFLASAALTAMLAAGYMRE